MIDWHTDKTITLTVAGRKHRGLGGGIRGIIALCEYLGEDKCAEMSMIEIGSHGGCSTELFANYFKEVYAIDPFTERKPGHPDENIGEIFKKRLKRFEHVHMVDGRSFNVMGGLPNVDFIYIDGNHAYQSVVTDIKISLPKIKPDGYIGGHDYNPFGHPDVCRAVNELLGYPDIVFRDTSWIIKIDERIKDGRIKLGEKNSD